MISPKYRTKIKGLNLEVIDKDGNKEVFSSVKDVCIALKCSDSYVYQALRNGREIVGCKVRLMEP